MEFAIQYLQLVFGGRFSSVRTSDTLKALSGLEAEACIDPKDAKVLRDGYIFHRRLENRLRLVQGHSIARLPTSGRPLALLSPPRAYCGPGAPGASLGDYPP